MESFLNTSHKCYGSLAACTSVHLNTSQINFEIKVFNTKHVKQGHNPINVTANVQW